MTIFCSMVHLCLNKNSVTDYESQGTTFPDKFSSFTMSVRSPKGQGPYNFVRNTSCSSFYKQIDNLTSDTEFDHPDNVVTLKEITRRHWKPFDSKATCFNRSCRKQFATLLERHHHCRRCGEIFCGTCVQFRRRLNRLAEPDPDGEWYKVCKSCFDQDQLTDGHTQSHTTEFMIFRMEYHKKMAAEQGTLESPFWRCKLDLDRECQRLLRGFQQSFGQSEIRRTLHWMRSLVAVPVWMKSSVFVREDFATRCQVCQEPFTITKQKNFCRVCGIAVCKSCSSEDLLIYIPDGEKEKGGSCLPKLAIIRIVGCPSVEPEISCHLRVCPSCKDKLEARQIEAYEEGLNPSSSCQFLDHLQKVSLKFQESESRVRAHLPKYRKIINSMEDNTKKNTSNSNVQTLAKAQGDLADVLALYVTMVQQLKKLKPTTDSQALLLRTFIRAKCDFYINNMSTFRALKSKLCESVSPESLDFIQRFMDKKAIICTHLYLRQLVYETIHLCQRHKLEEVLPSFLTVLEQVVEGDVYACLHKESEDVETHMSSVKEMVRENLKEKKLINFSQSRKHKMDSLHINEVMQQRVEAILNQVNNQLQLISTNRSFQASKTSLERALKELREQKNTDNEDVNSFVFVAKPS